MGHFLWRTMVITHRYLGVAIGLLMLVWFVSGIVMMYVPSPRISEQERLRLLPPLAWQVCCNFGEDVLADDQRVLRAQVESYLGTPSLRLRSAGRPDSFVDLAQGARMRVDAEGARKVALEAAPQIFGQPAAVIAENQVTVDQWTLGRRDRPLYRFDFDDPDRTILYVSGASGQVALWVTQMQRFWNWFGTIPHFLYFTDLRVNGPLWSQVVIWTSIVGTFLTVVGLILGVAQFRRGAGGRVSPYRGWFYWHHLAGLVFGVATLTWVLSGLFSMNPWGFLEGRGGGGEGARVVGAAVKGSEVKASLEALRARLSEANVVSLTNAPLAGRLYWLATYQDGTIKRLDAAGNVTVPSETDLAAAAERIANGVAIAEQGMMPEEEDDYYFGRRRRNVEVVSAYRVILNDQEQTRYYLSTETGGLVGRFDATDRMNRWLFSGLHNLNFFAWMRWRPVWDVIMITLLLGGVGITATGCWLAIRRVRSDVVMLFRWSAMLLRWKGKPRIAEPSVASNVNVSSSLSGGS